MVKYWRALEAIESLGGSGTLTEVEAWDRKHHPADPLGNARADLEHLTVNSRSRPHYNYGRTNWRSDSGHWHDQLFKLVDLGPPKRVRYVLFNPAEHGHVDLCKNADGKWEVMVLPTSELGHAEAEAARQAFEQQPSLDSDHDARVWALTAVAQRRGQAAFRAQLLEAYGQRCAITGSNAAAVLEAAHIRPYRGKHTNRMDNGLLLRADIHTLFDLGLIWITPERRVVVAPSLAGTDYRELSGQEIRKPAQSSQYPNPTYLAEHAQLAQEKHGLLTNV